jgi:hypothetical protein
MQILHQRHSSVTALLFMAMAATASAATTPEAPDVSAWVQTPVGIKQRGDCHRIAPGHWVEDRGDVVLIHDLRGNVVDTIGNVAAVPASEELPAGSGWVVDTVWENPHPANVRLFNSTWQVPPAPLVWDNQLIYLFEGMTNVSHILQPVLQYGSSVDGGGAYWSIASWYVSSNGAAIFTAAVPVAVGSAFQGSIAMLSHNGTSFSYSCTFSGVPQTQLVVSGIGVLKTCYETLEGYGLNAESEYPNAPETTFYNILIELASGFPQMHWTPQVYMNQFGQHATVISNSSTNGAVELFNY